MMTLDASETVLGIPAEVAYSNRPFEEKIASSVRIAAKSISFSDGNNGFHQIDVNAINKQIWKDQLLIDVEKNVSEIRKEKRGK